jgi:tetratricopeptide (TPR) repeat protein
MLVHSIGWMLFGYSDAGHHALNILFHLLNGMLVYRLGMQLLRSQNAAGLAAIIFLLHPLQIESVAWIGELKNPLSTLFYLASCICYLNFYESQNKKQYIFSLALFVAACLCKSSVVVLPLCLFCFDMIWQNKFSLKFLINKIPFLALSLLFGIINLKTQSADQFINYSHAFPYYERLGYAGFAIGKYLQLFFLPFHQSVLYPYPQNKVAALIIGFLVVIAVGGGIYFLTRNKNMKLIALILLCIVNLALVLQFIPFGEVLYADRYMYVPLIFFAFLAYELLSKLKFNHKTILYAALLVFPVLSFARARVWKNSVDLYSDIIKKYPSSFVALNSIGVELMMRNEDSGALIYLDEAVKAGPRNYKGYYNRGLLLLKMKKPEAAIKSFNQAIELYDYHKAYVGRASAYFMINDLAKATQDAEYVLKTEPSNLKAMFIMANINNQLNKLDEAINQYNICIAGDPEDPDFYFKRAIAFGKKGNFELSLSDLSICIQLNPAYYDAYYWRAIAKINLKQNPCQDLNMAARNNIQPAFKALEMYCR